MATALDFPYMISVGTAASLDDGIDLVLEYRPDFVFLEINPKALDSGLSLHFISELHRYLAQLPKIIITTNDHSLCPTAFRFGVFDYLIHPIAINELRKTLLRFEKEIGAGLSVKREPIPAVSDQKLTQVNDLESIDLTQHDEKVTLDEHATSYSIEAEVEPLKNTQDTPTIDTKPAQTTQKPLVICVKSYGDYRYIDAAEICYLQADNNSTDIHLNSGEMITAFKTLKHFESVLQPPFVRIHNSYIVNCNYIGRIHTGNSVCHIKNSSVKIPFSKSYKENIEQIINSIASGNYLEI